MSVVERKDCRACHGPLETLYDFGELQIISFGDREDIKAPLHLVKCSQCHLLQLKDTVDAKKLFTHYYYRSSQNATMRDHLRGIVEEVQKRVRLIESDMDADWVIDIGANDGTLLDFYPYDLHKVGFEPSDIAKNTAANRRTILHDFFSADRLWANYPKIRAKVITAIAMFYDLDDPNAFLQDIKKVLAPDGLFVIEQNYLVEMLRTNNIGNVVHEHLCYYSGWVLKELLMRNGFDIEDVTYSDINGGVFRAYIRHTEFLPGEKHWHSDEEYMNLGSMQPYTDFIARVFKALAKLHEFIESRKLAAMEDMTHPRKAFVDIYGPSTRGLTLLQLAGLEAKHFRFAVDRNPEKVGLKYHGVPVVSEETMRANPPDYLLVLPTGFLGEFVNREMEVLKSGTKMIVPLPTPFILGVEEL